MTSVQMRSLFVPGRNDARFTAFSTHAPKRITIGIVGAEAFNGCYTLSSFNYQHFNLKYLFVDIAGVSFIPLELGIMTSRKQFILSATSPPLKRWEVLDRARVIQLCPNLRVVGLSVV